mgnify:CR=1 FL=1
MSRRLVSSPRIRKMLALLGVVGLLATGAHAVAIAGGTGGGGGGFGFFNNVGGVRIDAEGVVADSETDDRREFVDFLRRAEKPAEGEMADKTEMRMVSLKGLEAAIREANVKTTADLPSEIKYLAGLQRIQYVFVYPERNDIVLAGPGEGWAVSETGDIVGVSTGRPVLQLDDLMTAFRSGRNAAEGQGISVSIDPTAEGRVRYERFMSGVRQLNPQVLVGAREAMGPQQITLTGVPTDSRFARVLVAADYQMKRLAMDLVGAPIEDLPSFLDLMQRRRSVVGGNSMPRWWLACDYQPIARSSDGLAFELRGQGVKAMTEDDLIGADGSVESTGRVNPIAQQWAEKMTERYEALCAAQPIFGDLRNLMDMSVVAALVDKHDLLRQANADLPLLTGRESMESLSWPTPRAVATQCSFMKIGRNTVVTASGGVQIDSYSVADRQQEDAMVGVARSKADASGMGRWWWN